MEIGAFELHWVRSARRTVPGTTLSDERQGPEALDKDVSVEGPSLDAETSRGAEEARGE